MSRLGGRGWSLADQYNSIEQPGRNLIRAAQQRLDNAVLNAYGFSNSDDEVSQLLYLNQQLAGRQSADEPVRGPGADGLKSARVTDYMIKDPRNT